MNIVTINNINTANLILDEKYGTEVLNVFIDFTGQLKYFDNTHKVDK